MRGRTNIVQRPAPIINGDIKEFIVESGNTINVGDFVTPVVKTGFLYSDSIKDYPFFYLGKHGEKHFYCTAAQNTTKLFALNSNGEEVFTMNFTNGPIYNVNQARPICPFLFIGNIMLALNYFNQNSNVTVNVYKFDDSFSSYSLQNTYIVFNNSSKVSVTVNSMYRMSDDKAVTTITYGSVTKQSIITVSQDGSAVVNQLNNSVSVGRTFKNSSGEYFYFSSTTVRKVNITQNSIEYSDSLSFSSVGDSVRAVDIGDDNFCIIGSAGIQVFDALSKTLRARITISQMYKFAAVSIANNKFLLQHIDSSTTSSTQECYYTIIEYISSSDSLIIGDRIQTGIKAKYNSTMNSEWSLVIAEESSGSKRIFFLYEDGSMRIAEERLSGYILSSISGDYVKKYSSGNISLGFAKTGGNAGDTVQIYVPK